MPLEDKRLRRTVEREISKHPVYATLLHVSCINDVIYLDGIVSEIRGGLGRNVNVEREMQQIVEAIESMSAVRDVVADYRIT